LQIQLLPFGVVVRQVRPFGSSHKLPDSVAVIGAVGLARGAGVVGLVWALAKFDKLNMALNAAATAKAWDRVMNVLRSNRPLCGECVTLDLLF
jgi:hypothetical protein